MASIERADAGAVWQPPPSLRPGDIDMSKASSTTIEMLPFELVASIVHMASMNVAFRRTTGKVSHHFYRSLALYPYRGLSTLYLFIAEQFDTLLVSFLSGPNGRTLFNVDETDLGQFVQSAFPEPTSVKLHLVTEQWGGHERVLAPFVPANNVLLQSIHVQGTRRESHEQEWYFAINPELSSIIDLHANTLQSITGTVTKLQLKSAMPRLHTLHAIVALPSQHLTRLTRLVSSNSWRDLQIDVPFMWPQLGAIVQPIMGLFSALGDATLNSSGHFSTSWRLNTLTSMLLGDFVPEFYYALFAFLLRVNQLDLKMEDFRRVPPNVQYGPLCFDNHALTELANHLQCVFLANRMRMSQVNLILNVQWGDGVERPLHLILYRILRNCQKVTRQSVQIKIVAQLCTQLDDYPEDYYGELVEWHWFMDELLEQRKNFDLDVKWHVTDGEPGMLLSLSYANEEGEPKMREIPLVFRVTDDGPKFMANDWARMEAVINGRFKMQPE